MNIVIVNVVVAAAHADNVVVAIVRIIVDNQSIVAVARYERTFVAIFPINIIVAAAEADVTAADCNIASALAGSFNCICTQAAVNGIIARAYVDNISVRIALDRNKIVAIARVNRSAAFAGDCDIVVAVACVNRRSITAADNCIVPIARQNFRSLDVVIVNVIIAVAQIEMIIVAVIRISCHVDKISAIAANNRAVAVFQRNWIIAVTNINITVAAWNGVTAVAGYNRVRAVARVNSVVAVANFDCVIVGRADDWNDVVAVARGNIVVVVCVDSDIVIAVARVDCWIISAGDNCIVAVACGNCRAHNIIIID